jgi:hypothetical protein
MSWRSSTTAVRTGDSTVKWDVVASSAAAWRREDLRIWRMSGILLSSGLSPGLELRPVSIGGRADEELRFC